MKIWRIWYLFVLANYSNSNEPQTIKEGAAVLAGYASRKDSRKDLGNDSRRFSRKASTKRAAPRTSGAPVARASCATIITCHDEGHDKRNVKEHAERNDQRHGQLITIYLYIIYIYIYMFHMYMYIFICLYILCWTENAITVTAVAIYSILQL